MGLEKINEYRKRAGISIEELSLKSGVPIGTLSKITAGITKDPKLETVRSLVYALGITLDDLEDNLKNTLTPEATEVAQAYDKADMKTKNIIRMTLDLPIENAKITELPKKKETPDHLILNAARPLKGATEEDMKHDDDIMDDPNF